MIVFILTQLVGHTAGCVFRCSGSHGRSQPVTSKKSPLILLMEEILRQLIGSLSHHLQSFLHLRWCRISSINSTTSMTFCESHRQIHSWHLCDELWRGLSCQGFSRWDSQNYPSKHQTSLELFRNISPTFTNKPTFPKPRKTCLVFFGGAEGRENSPL